MVRKIQEGGTNGDGAASAGDIAGAEVTERVKKKSTNTTAAGRKRKQTRPSLVPESSRVKKLQLKSQGIGEGEDLLDTSEEMVDEEFEPVGEGHGTNLKLEERNKKVLQKVVREEQGNLEERNKKKVFKEVVREEQGGEGETGITLEESEEDSKLLTIRYQGEEKEVYTVLVTSKVDKVANKYDLGVGTSEMEGLQGGDSLGD